MKRGSWVVLVVMVTITSLVALATFVPELGALVAIATWFSALLIAIAVVRSVSRRIRRRRSALEPLAPVMGAAKAWQDIYLGRTYTAPVTYPTSDISTSDVTPRSDWISDGAHVMAPESDGATPAEGQPGR